MARKTRKVLEINEVGHHYICIKYEDDPMNAYRIYELWYDGRHHRRQIDKYADMMSVMFFLTNRMSKG